MHSFVRNFITEWRRLGLPFSSETVVVAVSGGADSVSLLLALHDLRTQRKLGHRIVAAHFNHKLRGAESDADEDYVRSLTTKLGVELAIGHGDISHDGNLEQNARVARYNFLASTAKNLNAFAVVTGHTINDQAETFLLNLIRGSGPDGLSGMKVIRFLEEEKRRTGEKETPESDGTISSSSPLLFTSSPLLIRPLLNWAKRIDTEEYCHDRGVAYRYDTMNEDTAFKRVRIRKILLPLLEDFNPKIIDTLAQTAALMASVSGTSSATDDSAKNGQLVLKDLKLLEQAELYNKIRVWLKQQRGTMRGLELKHIEAVGRLILSAKSGRAAELPGGGCVIKSAGKLVYKENKVEN